MQYWNTFSLLLSETFHFTKPKIFKMQNLEEVHSLIYKSIVRTKQEQTELTK